MIRPPILPPFFADANAPPAPAAPMAAPDASIFLEPPAAPLPPAPAQMPAAPEQSRLSRIMELFALGAALGAGPQGGGTGILQGVSQAREQQKAEREQQMAEAQRQQQLAQAEAYRQQQIQAQQQQKRLDYIKEAQKAASAARTPEEHEQIVALYERASGQVLGAQLRPGVLRRLVPYNGPTPQSDAQKVLDQIQKGKYAEEILSNPETAIEGVVNGERVRRSLREWQAMAGAATVIGPQGKPQMVPKGAADTQATYERLKQVFVSDHKREPDEKEDYKLWLQAKKDIGQADDRAPRVTVNVGDKNAPQPMSPYQRERNVRNLQSVDELLQKVSRWTVGAGSLLASLPETDARDFAAELDTLKANIGFAELTAMREASKTGGALGQVSDREVKLLTSTLGALDPGQSPANFRRQLIKIRDSIKRWEAAVEQYGGGNGSQRIGRFKVQVVQ